MTITESGGLLTFSTTEEESVMLTTSNAEPKELYFSGVVNTLPAGGAVVMFGIDGGIADEMYSIDDVGAFEFIYPNDDPNYQGSIFPIFYLVDGGDLIARDLRFGPK